MTKNNYYKIIKKILSSKKNIIYINNDMYYINCDDIVFGLDLNIIKYFGYNPEKFLKKIKEKSHVILINTDIIIEYKDYIEKINDIKYIPYLYSFSNEKNNTISHIFR
jgi:hypothetical protein